MGFFDKAIKNIVKKAKPILPVAAMFISLSDVKEMKEKILRDLGKISIIVNCSTLPVPSIKFADLAWEDMQDHYDVNIKGSFNLLKTFMPDWEIEQFGYKRIIGFSRN